MFVCVCVCVCERERERERKRERERERERKRERVSKLVLSAQSTTKDYIRAEHKLQTTSKLFIPHVIIPQVMFF